MRAFQPAADLLSRFIPALRKMPTDLVERNHANWAPAVQHILFFGWLYLLLAVVWITSDMLFFNREFWKQAGVLVPQSRLKTILICVGAIAIAAPVIYFGLTPAAGRRPFFGLLGLSILAGVFPIMAMGLCTLMMACARPSSRSLNADACQSNTQGHWYETFRDLYKKLEGR
jgi:hypothetical protein